MAESYYSTSTEELKKSADENRRRFGAGIGSGLVFISGGSFVAYNTVSECLDCISRSEYLGVVGFGSIAILSALMALLGIASIWGGVESYGKSRKIENLIKYDIK